MLGYGEIERLQMCVEQRGLPIQAGLNRRKLDLPLGLDLELDRVVLRHLLLEPHLVHRERGVDLRPRLYGQ